MSQARRPGVEFVRIIERATDPTAESERILLYAKDVGGTTQIFSRASDGTIVQISSPVSSMVSWTAAKTWAAAYSEIQSLDGPVICLVERSGGFRTMTNNGGVPTELWDVHFVSVEPMEMDFSSPRNVGIQVDSGFLLAVEPTSLTAILHSTRIDWQFNCTGGPIVSASPVLVDLDGGRLNHTGGAYAFITDQFLADIRNGCRLIGTGGTALVRLTANSSVVKARTSAEVGNSTFATTTGAKTLVVYVDTSVEINGVAFGALVTATINGSAALFYSPDGTQWPATVNNAGELEGLIIPGGGIYSANEIWAQLNVAANQSNVALSGQVSTEFDTIKMTRSGSIVGLSTRLTEAITAGTLTVEVTKNGVATSCLLIHTTGVGSVFVQDAGIDTYVAGDLIGVRITTNVGFLPITTDLEAYVQLYEGTVGIGGGGVAIGSTVTSSTDGSILFVGSGSVLAQDPTQLFWDDTNNRLGLGTNAPGTILDIAGAGNTAGLALRGGGSTAVSAAGSARLRFNQGTNKLQVSENGAAYADVASGPVGIAIGGAITSATAGSVLFAGAAGVLQQDNANFFWDDGNNRLGIGNAAPATELHVTGTARATAGLTIDAMTAGSVWFAGASGALAQDNARFLWNDTTKVLQLSTNHATTGPLNITATLATAPSAIALFNHGSAFQGYMGWFNNLYGGYTYMRDAFGVLALSGQPFVLGSQFVAAHVFATQNTAIYYQMYQGGAAAVAPAATGRIQLSGAKFQISTNTGAYFDIGTYAAALTTGSVLFANASNQIAQDNANFFWDDTNNRLGVGTNAPAYQVDIRTSGATQFHLANVANGDSGMYLSSGNESQSLVTGGVAWNGSNWVAKHTEAGLFGLSGGLFTVRYDTGLTPSGTYTPTTRFSISSAGVVSIPALTTGSVPFIGASGAILQDNANLFWDDTNNTLGLGTASPLSNYRLSVRTVTSGSGIQITGSNTAAYSGLDFYDSAAAFAGSVGYGNSAVAIAHVQSRLFFYSGGADWVLANATRNEVTFGMTTGSTFMQMQNGGAAAVSAANTGRLRYSTTGQKFQVSTNGGAYVDLGTLAVERLSVDGAASPTIDITFVSGSGTDLTLADGSVDGFIKNFVITGGTGTITPTNLADGNVLTWSAVPANVSFIWDTTGATWHVHGNPYNMVTT